MNLLIALEVGAVHSVTDIIPWSGSPDTVLYGYRPDIYRDMTIAEAFRLSAVWAFIELAKKVGYQTYRDYLARSHYGNLQISESPDFWNMGTFAVSPVEQVQFLRGLYAETLPFSKANMKAVKKIMLAEQNEGYSIYAKTGWTRDNGINTGWWVGWIESSRGVTFFATKLLQDRRNNQPNFGECRKQITKAVLKELGLLQL